MKSERAFITMAEAFTLIAIGAHTLCMDDFAELGPLDVQLSRDDEFISQMSSLVAMRGLDAVQSKASQAFETFMIDILARSSGRITTKTAADIAVKMMSALYQPIMNQFDPMRIGEHDRLVNIASQYGNRLNQKYNNLRDGSLNRLIYSYPSHGFVIDRDEAGSLFKEVLPFDDQLSGLLENVLTAKGNQQNPVFYFNDPGYTQGSGNNDPANQEGNPEPSGMAISKPEGSNDQNQSVRPIQNAGRE